MPTILCDENHRYTVDGVSVPGVNEILDDVLGKPFYPDDGGAAMKFGTLVHETCQMDDEGDLDEESVDPSILPRLAAFREFKRLTGWVTLSRETMVSHPAMYAGRYDYCGTMPVRGRVRGVLLDLKSGKPLKRVRLQLAAYKMAIQAREDIDLLRASVWLKETGQFSIDVFEDRADETKWKSVLAAYFVKQEMSE